MTSTDRLDAIAAMYAKHHEQLQRLVRRRGSQRRAQRPGCLRLRLDAARPCRPQRPRPAALDALAWLPRRRCATPGRRRCPRTGAAARRRRRRSCRVAHAAATARRLPRVRGRTAAVMLAELVDDYIDAGARWPKPGRDHPAARRQASPPHAPRRARRGGIPSGPRVVLCPYPTPEESFPCGSEIERALRRTSAVNHCLRSARRARQRPILSANPPSMEGWVKLAVPVDRNLEFAYMQGDLSLRPRR